MALEEGDTKMEHYFLYVNSKWRVIPRSLGESLTAHKLVKLPPIQPNCYEWRGSSLSHVVYGILSNVGEIYVGTTGNLLRRLLEIWTPGDPHRPYFFMDKDPIALIFICEGDERTEQNVTLLLSTFLEPGKVKGSNRLFEPPVNDTELMAFRHYIECFPALDLSSRCYKCGDDHHYVRSCPDRWESCSHCGARDHTASVCPKRHYEGIIQKYQPPSPPDPTTPTARFAISPPRIRPPSQQTAQDAGAPASEPVAKSALPLAVPVASQSSISTEEKAAATLLKDTTLAAAQVNSSKTQESTQAPLQQQEPRAPAPAEGRTVEASLPQSHTMKSRKRVEPDPVVAKMKEARDLVRKIIVNNSSKQVAVALNAAEEDEEEEEEDEEEEEEEEEEEQEEQEDEEEQDEENDEYPLEPVRKTKRAEDQCVRRPRK